VSHVRRVTPTFVLGLVLPASAMAQVPAESASLIGQRVRVQHCNASGWQSPDGGAPCYRSEGNLLAVTPGALHVQLREGLVREIPRVEVQRFERSLGSKRSTGRDALIGGGVGLGLGLLMGVAVASEAGDDPVAPFVVGAPLVGGAVGALIGAGIGSLSREEKWMSVADEELAVVVVGGLGTVGLGLRLAF